MEVVVLHDHLKERNPSLGKHQLHLEKNLSLNLRLINPVQDLVPLEAVAAVLLLPVAADQAVDVHGDGSLIQDHGLRPLVNDPLVPKPSKYTYQS